MLVLDIWKSSGTLSCVSQCMLSSSCKVSLWTESQVSPQVVFMFKASHLVSPQRAIQPQVLSAAWWGRQGQGGSSPCWVCQISLWRFYIPVFLCRIKHRPLADTKIHAVQEGRCLSVGTVLPERQAWGLLGEDALGPLHLTIARSPQISLVPL